MPFKHIPIRVPLETPEELKVIYSADEGGGTKPYIIIKVNPKKSSLDAMSTDGYINTFKLSENNFSEEKINTYPGIWSKIRKLGKKIELSFGGIKYTTLKGESWAVHEEVIYRLMDCDNGAVIVTDGKHEKMLPLDSVRVFITKEDAKDYIEDLFESWEMYEVDLKKRQQLLKLGFCKLDMKKLKDYPRAESYLASDAPNAYVKVAASNDDLSLIVNNVGTVPLEYVEIINEKEYKDGIEHEKQMKEKRIIGQRILRAMENELKAQDSTIAQLQSRLVNRLRERSEFIKRIQTGNLDDAMNIFYNSLEIIKGYDNVAKSELKDSVLTITTKDIMLKKLETQSLDTKLVPLPLNIGSFKVCIDFLNNTVAVASEKSPSYIKGKHPHVGSSNTLCTGNMLEPMVRAFGAMDLVTVADIAFTALEQINDHGYSRASSYINLSKLPK